MKNRIDRRVVRLEKRVDRVVAMVRKLYDSYYKAQMRRGNAYGQLLTKTKDRLLKLSKSLPTFYRLSMVARQINRGRILVTLTRQERQILHVLLKRKKPFAPRPGRR